MKFLTIIKKDKVLKGMLDLPSSKSISNRLLIIRALSGHDFTINQLSGSEDTRLLVKLLSGIHAGSRQKKVLELDTANAGTVMRFLTAYLAFQSGNWMLTGSERMKQRPIGVLVEALKSLGADINYLGKPGFPPIIIHGKQEPAGNRVQVDPGISSQYISALMMVAPLLPKGLTISLKGNAVSRPYIDMTAGLMESYGVKITQSKDRIHIFPGTYQSHPFTVEADWSAAAFWYEAASMAEEVEIELKGLKENSLQGDAILSRIFLNFGVHTTFNEAGAALTRIRQKTEGYFFDFNDYPDIAPSVITSCAILGLHGRFEGLKSLKIKETDRLLALKNELSKLGIQVRISDSDTPTLELKASNYKKGTDLVFETYGDHRMAMMSAMLAMVTGPVKIINPDVVDKSYPAFWEHLQSIGFEIK